MKQLDPVYSETEVFKTTSWQPQKNRSAWMICRVHPLQKMSAFKKIFQETLPIHVISARRFDVKVSFYNILQNITKTDRKESRALYEVQQVVVLYNCYTLWLQTPNLHLKQVS